MISFEVRNETFGTSIVVVIGKVEECNNLLKKLYNLDEDAFFIGRKYLGSVATLESEEIGYTEHVLWIKDYSRKGTLAHECSHVVHKIFKERNINHTEETDEVYAYLMSWLMDAIECGYNLKTKKKRKNEHKTKKQ